jgi:hypothetical protein
VLLFVEWGIFPKEEDANRFGQIGGGRTSWSPECALSSSVLTCVGLVLFPLCTTAVHSPSLIMSRVWVASNSAQLCE